MVASLAAVQPARLAGWTRQRPASTPARRTARVLAENGAGDKGNGVVNEDVIARLKAAEEEAQQLKRQLAAAQAAAAASGSSAAAAEPVERAAKRIDSGDMRRETMFSGVESKQRNWLSENDVAFFTGGGPGEADGEGVSPQEQAVVQRRLILGAVASVALGAFALVPTQQLQLSQPSKPLFFYLVPLLRAQALLAQAEAAVPDGDLLALQSLLARILGDPNNLQANLRDAAACLPTTKEVEVAGSIGRDVYEYVRQIDYDQYFETMKGAVRDGAAQKQYYDFSLNSARAAQAKLREFLALMPADQREAAAQQLASLPF